VKTKRAMKAAKAERKAKAKRDRERAKDKRHAFRQAVKDAKRHGLRGHAAETFARFVLAGIATG
jgi:Flp pilus assembly protein TadB